MGNQRISEFKQRILDNLDAIKKTVLNTSEAKLQIVDEEILIKLSEVMCEFEIELREDDCVNLPDSPKMEEVDWLDLERRIWIERSRNQ